MSATSGSPVSPNVSPPHPIPMWVTNCQSALAAVITFPPLKPKLLEKPPFAYIHDILANIRKRVTLFDDSQQTGIEDKLWNIHALQAKSTRLRFIECVITFIESRLGRSLQIAPKDVVECRNCEKTGELLTEIAQLASTCFKPHTGDGTSSSSPSVISSRSSSVARGWPISQINPKPVPPVYILHSPRTLPISSPEDSVVETDEEKNQDYPIHSPESTQRGTPPLRPTQPPPSTQKAASNRLQSILMPLTPNTPVTPTPAVPLFEKKINSPALLNSPPAIPPVPPSVLAESKQLFSMFIPITSLTPQRLNNINFEFIHELVINVMDKTGFGEQVLAPNELSLQRLQNNLPGQLDLLARLIRYVGLALDKPVFLTPDQLLDGQHLQDTHLFLQSITKACLNPHLHMPTLLRRYIAGEEPQPPEDSVSLIHFGQYTPSATLTGGASLSSSPRIPSYIISTQTALLTLLDDSNENDPHFTVDDLRLVTFTVLHRIIQVIIEKTGFFSGLFPPEASNLHYFFHSPQSHVAQRTYIERLLRFMDLALAPPGVQVKADTIVTATNGGFTADEAAHNGYAKATNTLLQQMIYTAVDPEIDLGAILKQYSEKYPAPAPLSKITSPTFTYGKITSQPHPAILAAYRSSMKMERPESPLEDGPDGADVLAAPEPWDGQGSLAAAQRDRDREREEREFINPDLAEKKRAHAHAPPLQSLVKSGEDEFGEGEEEEKVNELPGGFEHHPTDTSWIINASPVLKSKNQSRPVSGQTEWARPSPLATELASQKKSKKNQITPISGEDDTASSSTSSSTALPKRRLEQGIDEAAGDGAAADAGVVLKPSDMAGVGIDNGGTKVSDNVLIALAAHKTPFTARPLILAKNYTLHYAASITLGAAMLLTVIFWRAFPPPHA